MQQATLMYIASQLMTKADKEELQQTFIALDKNADGKLSKDELVEGYTKVLGSKEQALEEVKQIMDIYDLDHNGYIDFSGTYIHDILNRIFIGLYK